ncbi:MAG TPA: rhodanese-like domain-containing protein [Candidatus Koribacter sp.]|jgi:rhodanese-related sulfurtransferase
MKRLVSVVAVICCGAMLALASGDIDAAHQITPEALAKTLQSGKLPLILNVGPKLLYDQAHIRGAEYMGAASSDDGLTKLRERVKSLPKSAAIVMYCGCCPWEHCPNVRPAYAALHRMGFTNVKVMHVVQNIGTDWVDKGYPTEKGK